MEASYQRGASHESNENFERLCQTIASNIKKFSQNVTAMSKMTSQLQTPQDSQELKNRLRQIQNYTQQLAKDTSALMMELMKLPVDAPASALARDRLRDEYMATLNAFQATQKVAAQKTKEDVRKARAQTVTVGDPFAVNEPPAPGAVELHAVGMGQAQAARELQELHELEQRERDVRQLEADIVDVNLIFKDLGTMIHDQASIVNSIESSVEYATQSVESATSELASAATYKNKLQKKKIYLTVILIIVIAIILLIVFSR